MKTCEICGNKAGLFRRKIHNGYVCNKCVRNLSNSIRYKDADADFLKSLYAANEEKKNEFEHTAVLGSLYIDSIHGMICISKRTIRGKPAEFGDIYRIEELREAGLYCTNIRNIGTHYNNVVCDVKFRVRTENVSRDFLLLTGKKCPFKEKNGGLQCDEPPELSMFRNIFNQMIEDRIFQMAKKLELIHEMQSKVHTPSTLWAKGILFIGVDDECSESLVKERRNMLVKIFHTDRHTEFGDETITAMINEAFRILKP